MQVFIVTNDNVPVVFVDKTDAHKFFQHCLKDDEIEDSRLFETTLNVCQGDKPFWEEEKDINNVTK